MKVVERKLEPGWLEQARKLPGISEGKLVDRALRCANTSSVESFLSFTAQLDLVEQSTPPTEGMEQTRQRFRDALKAIVDGKVPAARIQSWRGMADGILTIESPSGSDKYHFLEVEHHEGHDPGGLFSLVLLWMVDSARPYHGKLCQCRYRKCGRFFFEAPAKAQGKPRRLYCPVGKEDHMKLEDIARRADKMKLTRARKGK